MEKQCQKGPESLEHHLRGNDGKVSARPITQHRESTAERDRYSAMLFPKLYVPESSSPRTLKQITAVFATDRI